MVVLTADRLIAACSDESEEAGITIRTVLEPLGGVGAPVKPATYAGPQAERRPRFQAGKRWWGAGPERRVVDILTIDNEPSQANRLEAALEHRRAELGLPEIVLDRARLLGARALGVAGGHPRPVLSALAGTHLPGVGFRGVAGGDPPWPFLSVTRLSVWPSSWRPGIAEGDTRPLFTLSRPSTVE